LETGVNPHDYAEIRRLLSIYDQTENNITRQQQRFISKHALCNAYAKRMTQ